MRCPLNAIAISAMFDGTSHGLVKQDGAHWVVQAFSEQRVSDPVLYFLKMRIRYQLAIRVRDASDQERNLRHYGPPIE